MTNTVYGYCRISTMKQRLERQVDNIKREYPNAVIISEEYTGTTTDRPKWNRLYKRLKSGDTVVFDEVSRMSRNAEEGFALYEELYKRGVNLIFLKERHIDTSVYRETTKNNVSMTGTDVDIILKAVNEYLMILAKRQIEIAFQTAQAEVDFIHQRTSEGVRKAQADGKQVGRAKGSKIETKKAKEMKQIILEFSKDFRGSKNDKYIMETFHVSRNSYYKYKRELQNA